MSSPHPRPSSALVRERSVCMCAVGHSCSSFAPGHALHLIQARLASATPTDWADAIVESIDESTGDIVVRTIDDGSAIVLWSAAIDAGLIEAGSPVALHTRYDVLAVGRRQFNCAKG